MQIRTTTALRGLGLAVLLMLAAGAAGAGCFYNGQEYPEGSKVGGYTCRNGSWEP